MSPDDAHRALAELSLFGARARQHLLGSADPSPWGPAAWGTSEVPTPPAFPQRPDGPSGLVVHYTASPSLAGTVEYFCRPALGARASAHLVVGRLQEPWGRALSQDLPWVGQLPVTVVECRPPTLPAWHATWANCAFFGIEVVNLGYALPPARYVTGPGVPGPGAPASVWDDPWVACGRHWQQYPPDQRAALAACIGAVATAFGLPAWSVVGHEQVQGTQTHGATGCDKRDPGPALPLMPLRVASGFAPQTTPDDGAGAALARLGYAPAGDGRQPSVELFQRLMGLVVDGDAGPRTQAALAARLVDRGLALP